VEATPEAERLTLALPAELPAGDHRLRLAFSGRLNDNLVGLYRSRYRDDAGREHTLLTTHFEATDARRCFPCWDEPDLKASFVMTLVVPDGLTALTNAPEIGREAAAEGFTRVRFAESMVMSTYLVCVVVRPLALSPASDADGVRSGSCAGLTVCTWRPTRMSSRVFALGGSAPTSASRTRAKARSGRDPDFAAAPWRTSGS
jgi:puromycin-sensitive aminopeptidase